MRSLRRLLVAAAFLVVVTAAPAGATSATSAEVRALAAEARDDPRALDRLRAVDEVDGMPVDLAAGLGGLDDDELDARLATLAAGAEGEAVTGARSRAEAILAGDDFQRKRTPRPLRGVLRWIGERLEPITEPINRVLGVVVQGGWASVAIAAAIVLATTGVAVRVANQRTLAVLLDGEGGWRGGRSESPDQLERLADAAERDGDHESALRLRFRAGLLRLHAAGALTYRPSLTTGAVTQQVRSATLAELAGTVEEVVYGGRPASAADVADARQRWPRVLEEAGRR